MPHVPAPAPPADRSEGGGRHGRPGRRTGRPPLTIRASLLALAVLPAAIVALCGALALVLASGRTAPAGVCEPVLSGAALLTVLALTGAAVAAHRLASGLSGRIVALRRGTARGQAELHDLAEAVRRGAPRAVRAAPAPIPRTAASDELGRLAADLDRARHAAVAAVLRAARRAPEQLSNGAGQVDGRQPVSDADVDADADVAEGSTGRGGDTVHLARTVAVSTHLARRMQVLVHRGIAVLDELEKETEDPDVLKSLFQVDHLATRLRRHAENAAVLGGAPTRRRWSRPVPLIEVLRSAMAEVEQYQRVVLVPPVDGSVRGHAVTDVAHVLAELIENATVFSAPGTHVMLRAATVTAGLAIEVEDRGLGMAPHEQARMNMLLTEAAGMDVTRLLYSGRTGLYVVARLARRHGITVRLQSNIYGGTQAVLVLPRSVLGPVAPPATAESGSPQLQPAPAPSGPMEAPPRVSGDGGAVPGTHGAGPDPQGGEPHAQDGGLDPLDGAEPQVHEGERAWADSGASPDAAGAAGPEGHTHPGHEGHGGVAPDTGGPAHARPRGGSPDDAAREHTVDETAHRTAASPSSVASALAGAHGASVPVSGASGVSVPVPRAPGASVPDTSVPAARPCPEASAPPAATAQQAAATGSHAGERAGLPRRQAPEHTPGHPNSGPEARQPAGERGAGGTGPNPGLMAAFRRGSDLGAAQRGTRSRPGTQSGGS